MAWQPYVTELMKNNNLDHGAICGANDGLIWASDPGFKLSTYDAKVHVDVDTEKTESVNEQAILLDIFKTKGQVASKAGIRLNGVKYVVTTFDEDESAAYMKSDDGGACAIKTTQCILIGTYNSKANKKQCAGNCNQDVAKLAAALKSSGY